jgi:hypothetical protein
MKLYVNVKMTVMIFAGAISMGNYECGGLNFDCEDRACVNPVHLIQIGMMKMSLMNSGTQTWYF